MLRARARARLAIAHPAAALTLLYLRDRQPGDTADALLPVPLRVGTRAADPLSPRLSASARRRHLRRLPALAEPRALALPPALERHGRPRHAAPALHAALRPVAAANSDRHRAQGCGAQRAGGHEDRRNRALYANLG